LKSTIEKINNLVMGQSMKDEVKRIFLEYANRKPLIVFENIGANLIASYSKEDNYPVSFAMQLSGLNIKAIPENYSIIDTMHATYKKDCRVSVYVEVMK
jgi:hypothetical protein